MKKKILILGASRYYIKSIQTSKKLGYYTYVVDKVADSPGFKFADKFEAIDITDYQSILNFSSNNKIDGIVALNDFGVYTAAYVSSKMNLPGLKIDIANILINKAKLRKKWEEKGQPNPKYIIVNTFEECREACININFPVILKPAVSRGGSRGIIYVKEKNNLKSAYKFSTSYYEDKTILVEEFLKGIEHSAEVLVYQGKGYILAISDKIKTPLPARVDKNVLYPTIFTGEQKRKLEQVIINSVESLDIYCGCAHVECCTLPSGEVKLFEIGGRPGGGGTPDPIVPFVTGINEMEQYLRISVGDVFIPIKPKYERGCNYHFIIPKPGKIKEIKGLEEILKWNNILDAALFIKKNDIIKKVRIGSDRSGFIIAGGKNRTEAYDIGVEAEKNIKISYF